MVESPVPSARHAFGRLSTLRLATIGAVLLIAFFVAWSFYAKMDIIAVATGRVVPDGEAKIVQAGANGIVTQLAVSNNTPVQAGDLLVQLDDSHLAKAIARIEAQIMEFTLDLDRAEAHLSDGGEGYEATISTLRVGEEILEYSEKLFKSEREAFQARVAAFNAKIAQISEEVTVVEAEIVQFEAHLDFLRSSLQAEEALSKRGIGASLTLLEKRAAVAEAEGNIGVLNARIYALGRQIATQEYEKLDYVAAWRLERSEHAEEIRRSRSDLLIELGELQIEKNLHRITAPTDGIAQDLEVNTIGATLSFGDPVLKIVPDTQELRISALIQNKDIGFVEEGQEAILKFEAFPFTKHGSIRGTVTAISLDIIEQDDQPPPVNTSTDINSRAVLAEIQQFAQNTLYEASVSLSRDYFIVEGQEERIRPGMTATVDIKIGERRLIDFLLSPISRYLETGLRER